MKIIGLVLCFALTAVLGGVIGFNMAQRPESHITLAKPPAEHVNTNILKEDATFLRRLIRIATADHSTAIGKQQFEGAINMIASFRSVNALNELLSMGKFVNIKRDTQKNEIKQAPNLFLLRALVKQGKDLIPYAIQILREDPEEEKVRLLSAYLLCVVDKDQLNVILDACLSKCSTENERHGIILCQTFIKDSVSVLEALCDEEVTQVRNTFNGIANDKTRLPYSDMNLQADVEGMKLAYFYFNNEQVIMRINSRLKESNDENYLQALVSNIEFSIEDSQTHFPILSYSLIPEIVRFGKAIEPKLVESLFASTKGSRKELLLFYAFTEIEKDIKNVDLVFDQYLADSKLSIPRKDSIRGLKTRYADCNKVITELREQHSNH